MFNKEGRNKSHVLAGVYEYTGLVKLMWIDIALTNV